MNRPQQQQQQAALGAANSQSGLFRGAPASKLFCLATVVLYIFLNTQKALSLCEFDSHRILSSESGQQQFYRYVVSQWCFGSTGELITGTLLLMYWMRPLEREMGTRKFVVFAFVLVPVIAIALEWALVELGFAGWVTSASSAMVGGTSSSSSWRYSGPYPLLGAHLAWFHSFVPRLHPRFAQVLGFQFSEKSMIYLWCLQVVASGRWHTVAATAVGVVAWIIYLRFLATRVTVPNAVAKTVASFASRWTDPPPPIIVAATPGGGRGGGGVPRHAAAAAAVGAAAQRPVAPPPAPLAPDPSAIEQLTGMGFGRTQVVEALQATNNNVQRAADRLLSQQ